MNRRDFFSKASLAVAGIVAACGMLPELAKAEAPPSPYVPLKDEDFGVFPPWDAKRVPPANAYVIDQHGRSYIVGDALVFRNRTNYATWRDVTEA